MLVIIDGDDVVRAGEALRRLRAEADPAGLSTTLLDDPKTTLDEIIQAADAVPFFGGGRCVIVRGLLLRLTRTSERGKGMAAARAEHLAELTAYVGRLPVSTTLILWEPTAVRLPAGLEAAVRAGGQRLRFEAPSKPGELQAWLESWLLERGRERGVALTREAAGRLAANAVASIRAADAGEREGRVGVELQRLATELEKLGAYVGEAGKVDGRVVALLTPDARAQVFDLVDAVASTQTARALRLLETALADGQEPLALLRLIDRQISNLLRADLAGGEAAAIETRLKVPGWLARKYAQQARALGGGGLRRAHARLLAADLSIKTGRATPEAALRDAVLALCLTTKWPVASG